MRKAGENFYRFSVGALFAALSSDWRMFADWRQKALLIRLTITALWL
jgi:hypothetical protein